MAHEGPLAMKGIVKSFSGVRTLDHVNFTVKSGEIHALLGANGAGKSTLMKILSGAYEKDAGTIEIDGQPVDIRSPLDAKRHGIHCVYQEVDTALVPGLTIAENILLDRQVSGEGKWWISRRFFLREASAIARRVGLPLDVSKTVAGASLSEKQLTLIARAVAQKARFVIFDEPTAPLSQKEAEQLYRILEQLKSDSVGCIFISHRLPEVFRICDRITVMRDGKHVMTKPTADTSISEVIQYMLGKTWEEAPSRSHPRRISTETPSPGGGQPKATPPLLEVRGLSRGWKVRDVHLRVHPGEIVGVAGLVGAGKTELARLLFGADPIEKGDIFLRGKRLVLRQPKDAIAAGIVLVPEERRKEGVFVEENIIKNLSLPALPRFSRWGVLQSAREQAHARRVVEALGIKTVNLHQLAGRLSGGNQQKVAIGKWFSASADIFLFDEPTKGVDVGAKQEIFRLIQQLAQEGKGVLYLTCEWDELLGIAHRILVMSGGRIVKELAGQDMTQENILYYASGGRDEDERDVSGLLV
ncbi:MAG: sugar ABC transporter ATP-binding protein [Bacillota bacterium]